MFTTEKELGYNERMSYYGAQRRGGCSILGFFLFVFVLTILILVFVMLFILRSSYMSWENDFELEADPQQMVVLSDMSIDEVETIDEKVLKFQQSRAPVDYIELTPRETAYLLARSIEPALPSGSELEAVYIKTFEREWMVYFKTNYSGVSLPWVAVKVDKDNIESAKLEISEVHLGEWDLADFELGFVAEQADEGYGEALVLVNESGLTGRRMENLELGVDSLIIKGRMVSSTD